MLTVTELARRYHLSRATILYYEREGLLEPAQRSENGYRWYGDKEIQRLEAIAAYRSYGLPVASIKDLLDQPRESSQSQILKEHFYQLESEIARLKEQQRAIVAVLQDSDLVSSKRGMTKERWVAVMRAAGCDDDAMTAWHQQFEQMEPEEHQRFLESLGIEPKEIKSIRDL